MNIEKGVIEVIATENDPHLGGEDIDYILQNYCANLFNKESGENIYKNKKAMERLKTQCMRAKEILSRDLETTIILENIINNKDLYVTITRSILENLCDDIFQRLIKPLDRILNNKIVKEKYKIFNKKNIDEIILIGGSTKIPKVINIVEKYFNKKPCNSISPDEAVAKGAAIKAALLSNLKNSILDKLVLLDVTPLSLGVETDFDKKMSVIIEKNTKLPIELKQYYTTCYDNQTEALIQIYEGESLYTKNNNKLGEFILSGIPKMKKGEVNIEITFEINYYSILYIKAVELSKGSQNSLLITNKSKYYNYEELLKKKKKAKDDEQLIYNKKRKKTELKNIIENEKTILEYSIVHKSPELLNDAIKLSDSIMNYISLINIKIINDEEFENYLYHINDLFLSYKIILEKTKEINKINEIKKNIDSIIYSIKDKDINSIEKIIEPFKEFENIYYEILLLILKIYRDYGKNNYNNTEKLLSSKNCLYKSITVYKKFNIDEKIKQYSLKMQDEYNICKYEILFYYKRIKTNLIYEKIKNLEKLAILKKDEEKLNVYFDCMDYFRDIINILNKKIKKK